MKKYLIAVIVTCIGALFINLMGTGKTKQPPILEAPIPPVAVTEALQEPIEPVADTTPAPMAETINQAEANVTPNPVGCEYYRDIVSQYDWDVNVALAIMRAESGCRPDAFNPEWHRNCQGSLGLFQIACVHHDSTFDPSGNIAAAYRIYSSSGWRPWGAYTNGSYQRYL